MENHEIVASNLSGIVAAGRTSSKGTTNSSATACCIAGSPSRALILMTAGRTAATRTANGMPWSTSSFHRWRLEPWRILRDLCVVSERVTLDLA